MRFYKNNSLWQAFCGRAVYDAWLCTAYGEFHFSFKPQEFKKDLDRLYSLVDDEDTIAPDFLEYLFSKWGQQNELLWIKGLIKESFAWDD